MTARHRTWLLLTALALASGCSDAPRSEDAHLARHTALEVRHASVAVAQRIAERPDPRCGTLSLETRGARWGAFTTTLEIDVEVVGGGQLTQLVRVRRDARGNLAFVELFEHALDGLAGQRTREVRRVDGLWQVREDGQPFIELLAYDGQRVVAEALEAYDRLLAGLGPLAGDARSEAGLAPAPADAAGAVRCALRAGARSVWLDELGADWRVRSARAHVVADAGDGLPVRRELVLELELTEGRALDNLRTRRRHEALPERLVRVRLQETSRPGAAEPVVAATQRVTPTVERDFFHARALVQRRWREALVPAVISFQ